MNMKAITREITQLPPEGQLEVIDFVAFLQMRYDTKPMSPQSHSITDEPFVGMWKDRNDMEDSVSWVKNLRSKEWAGK